MTTSLDDLEALVFAKKNKLYDTEYPQGCQIGHFCGQINVTNRLFTIFGRHSRRRSRRRSIAAAAAGHEEDDEGDEEDEEDAYYMNFGGADFLRPVTFQMLWALATTNCGGGRPRIVSL